MKKTVFTVTVLVCFLVSCSRRYEFQVSLASLTPITVQGDRLNVSLIRSYPNTKACDAMQTNANLYVCVDISTLDTILVIEPCRSMPDFAKSDYKGQRDLTIEKEDILKQKMESVTISLTDTTIVKRWNRYVLASITKLEY